ncbi:DUF2927 domain-containing protein [Actinoplanes sp. CA-131856]
MRSAITKGLVPLLLTTTGFLAACHAPAHGSTAAPASSAPASSAPASVAPVSAAPPASPAPASPAPKPKVSKATLDYFLAVALGTKSTDKDNVVYRWTDELVTVRVHGLTDAGRSCLTKTIADFNALSRTTDLQLAEGPGDIELYVTPLSKFHSLDAQYDFHDNDVAWFNTHRDGNYNIDSATVLIRSDDTTARERCRLIRGELTQTMGFTEDSAKYASSIFYSEYTDAPSQYSPLDKAVIRLMYGDIIQPGDNRKTVTGRVTIS